MNATRVVHVRSGEPFDVYVGRPSKWGNPFKIGRDGTRAAVIEKYRAYVLGVAALRAALPSLRGRVLGCYCKPAACHGDVLAELSELDALPDAPAAPTGEAARG